MSSGSEEYSENYSENSYEEYDDSSHFSNINIETNIKSINIIENNDIIEKTVTKIPTKKHKLILWEISLIYKELFPEFQSINQHAIYKWLKHEYFGYMNSGPLSIFINSQRPEINALDVILQLLFHNSYIMDDNGLIHPVVLKINNYIPLDCYISIDDNGKIIAKPPLPSLTLEEMKILSTYTYLNGFLRSIVSNYQINANVCFQVLLQREKVINRTGSGEKYIFNESWCDIERNIFNNEDLYIDLYNKYVDLFICAKERLDKRLEKIRNRK